MSGSHQHILFHRRGAEFTGEEYFLRMGSLLGGLRASAVANNLKEEAHDYITS
jgi:hypothetical protein